ncbi:uncharacterized protein BJ171DRAFT_506609 [Polychytrium aggregatum]|uniref:uncharacterized protein n=1 Tax=Polychytrium aggregatum TaxID=110093 RepID=UPI0022FEF621|nr:uncharacterized protein BJ171DRAFT_506609 [Polychytrium aggregatum]KAI9204224.1 hypothetical protein BJ171DRAFT_506609 [Polychytrium aggregatum]
MASVISPLQDIFTIVCFNDAFQFALDHDTIDTLLKAHDCAWHLLSPKVPRFLRWCQRANLCDPDGQLKVDLTPSEKIALSLRYEESGSADRAWLVALADRGNAVASYFLARIIQTETDRRRFMDELERENALQQAFRRLEQASNACHPMAQFHLAESYRNGFGVRANYAKALELYRGLATRGMPRAQIAFGRCYENREGVGRNFDTAIEWYSKAADQGSEDGRLHIVFLQAWFSFIGHGVEKSDVDAFRRWREVSNQSTDPVLKPIATLMVGWMHYLGRGTVRDKQKGVRIIQDNRSNAFPLGEEGCLAGDAGPIWNRSSSDSPAALKFYQLCEMGSDRDCLCEHLMALCHFHGFGTTEDPSSGAAIFEQLAQKGHSESQFWIGHCYVTGLGRRRELTEAIEWFNESAENGNSYAQWMSGCCYDGEGRDQDEDEGENENDDGRNDEAKRVEWYIKSACQGNRYGQYELGRCLQYGLGVPKHKDTAIFWLRKAAEQGHPAATSSLERLGELTRA